MRSLVPLLLVLVGLSIAGAGCAPASASPDVLVAAAGKPSATTASTPTDLSRLDAVYRALVSSSDAERRDRLAELEAIVLRVSSGGSGPARFPVTKSVEHRVASKGPASQSSHLNGALLLVDGDAHVAFATDSIVIATGALEVAHARNSVLIGGLFVHVSHDGDRRDSGPGSFIASSGEAEVGFANGSAVLAPRIRVSHARAARCLNGKSPDGDCARFTEDRDGAEKIPDLAARFAFLDIDEDAHEADVRLSSGSSTHIKEGAELEGWIVSFIGEEQVVFRRGGEVVAWRPTIAAATCEEASAFLERHFATFPRTCTTDADCTTSYLHVDSCAAPAVHSKRFVLEDDDKLRSLQDTARKACSDTLSKKPPCAPKPQPVACTAGRCSAI